VSGQFHALIPLPLGKEALIPFEQEAGWVSDPVWTFLRPEMSLAPARILTLYHRTCNLVTVWAMLF